MKPGQNRPDTLKVPSPELRHTVSRGSDPRKVLLAANTSWYLYNFRLPLARSLAEHGFEVVLLAPTDEYTPRLEGAGFRVIPLSLDRKGTNPLTEITALLRLALILFRERPFLCHYFTIKCVIYGTAAARLVRVPAVVNSITGLGHVFLSRGLKMRLLRPYIVLATQLLFRSSHVRLIFQNPEDQQMYLDSGIGRSEQSALIRGSGVNVVRFAPAREAGPIVLFASRLLLEKGVLEFYRAAEILSERNPSLRFRIAGEGDPGNPSSVPPETLERWRREAKVELLGHVYPIDPILREASIVVLPSYREGTPKILLEAAAMEKPIVATDVPGCREAVLDGVTGLLVPPRDAEALAAAIQKLALDPELRLAMGRKARVRVEREFSEERVVSDTLDVYRSLRMFSSQA